MISHLSPMKLGMHDNPFQYVIIILTLNTLSHLLALVLDSERENPLFRSPVGKNPTHVLDIGTGKGNWAM